MRRGGSAWRSVNPNASYPLFAFFHCSPYNSQPPSPIVLSLIIHHPPFDDARDTYSTHFIPPPVFFLFRVLQRWRLGCCFTFTHMYLFPCSYCLLLYYSGRWSEYI